MDQNPLRSATPADFQTALGFIRAYYAHDGISFDEPKLLAGLNHLLADPSLGRVWLIVHGGQEVGYAILTFAFDIEFGGKEAFITDVYLVPEARGRGLGTQVLQAIERLAPSLGIGALELQVERHNLAAQALYRKLGFQPQDRIPMSKILR